MICISAVHCWLPSTKRTTTKNDTIFIPQDFLDRLNLANSLKVPTRDYCKNMFLLPENQYAVLPWWYHYCLGLKDKDDRGQANKHHLDSIHRYILNEAQAYKKRMKEKESKISELKRLLAS
ncbi:unnamed protein product [Chrysodeixis includens]|uniref:Uncharacterized protein n=1 Tax=Chrysodeixis includens TaxID=689277 RepID=A0A9P0BP82_CHRIL|nr:unnamed protein product [Chrysodeixis includens]